MARRVDTGGSNGWAVSGLVLALLLGCWAGSATVAGGSQGGVTAAAAKAKKCKKKGKKASAAKGRKGCRKQVPAPSPVVITPPAGGTPTTTPAPPNPPNPPGPVDTDLDGVFDSNDNCLTTANPGQEDSDSDAKGDACDQCPAAANPGTQGCPATIYMINQGITQVGASVRLSSVLVTAIQPDGDAIWVQHKNGDPAYVTFENGGIEVDTSGISLPGGLQAGNRVEIDGLADASQLDATSLSVTNASVEPRQADIRTPSMFVSPAAVTSLNGQLVTVQALTLDSQSGGSWTVSNGGDAFTVAPRALGTLPACANGSNIGQIVGVADEVGGSLRLLPPTVSAIDTSDC